MLDLQIQALLRSNEVKQIAFTMRGIRVTGWGFQELSNRFSDRSIPRRIRVTVRPELVSPTAEAEYVPDTDKILLRSANVLDTVTGRASVVHECTHAQLDMRGVSTPLRSEEAAAFIAEAWYLLACRVSTAIIDNHVSAEIRQIAQSLRERSNRVIGAPVEMTSDEINTARRVMGRFGYGSGHYTSDGIRGYRYSGD
jgi:hypothetical protein